jgi:hypothetical protein
MKITQYEYSDIGGHELCTGRSKQTEQSSARKEAGLGVWISMYTKKAIAREIFDIKRSVPRRS